MKSDPTALKILRMCTARDRLVGLSQVTRSVLESMENEKRGPPNMATSVLDEQLSRICDTIVRLRDGEVFSWLESNLDVAASIVGDRVSTAAAYPIIRNAQEHVQREKIRAYLTSRGYEEKPSNKGLAFPNSIEPRTFCFLRNLFGLG